VVGGPAYIGLPVTGFAVEKYVNGNVGGVLSNYGGSFIHKYSSNIGTTVSVDSVVGGIYNRPRVTATHK
jgi:hypothetical protein